MVIDAAKGVEAQTIKLLNVCRMRNTPIITFVNKLDREVREPFELLAEIESVLGIECAPITWPIGMGKSFRGVYHLLNDRLLHFAAGEERRSESERLDGLDNPVLDAQFPGEVGRLREDVDLIQNASSPFDLVGFLAGRQSPVFFGSAINNFAYRKSCRRCSTGHRHPRSAMPAADWSKPAEPKPSAVSCSRFRPTWTPCIGIESPSCGFARASYDVGHEGLATRAPATARSNWRTR
jgi:peptide chain release factor 3